MTKLVYDNLFDAVYKDKGTSSELKFRSDLLILLVDLFEENQMSQSKISKKLDIPQSRVSEITTGKIDKMSSEKLVYYLGKMGYYVKPKLVKRK